MAQEEKKFNTPTESREKPLANYYQISEETARTAHDMVHMGEYKSGSATANYRAAVDEAAELVKEQKSKVSPYYHGKLDSLLDLYARRLAAWTNDYNRNQASYPSQFISGASGYNMRKHNKQMSREDSLWKEYNEINGLLAKIRVVGTGPVDLADPNAREILAGQLQKLQSQLDRDKALNAYYRKHKSFAGFPGLSAEAADKLSAEFAAARERCPWLDKPCADYELTSLRGKIKRVQSRIAELDKLQVAAGAPSDIIKFDGGEIVRNTALNRLQIVFDDIPSGELRAILKSNGFRWSPNNRAWQRQLTQNAESAALRILGLN